MTNERLFIFLVFSNLIASKLLSSNRRMHNFIEKFTKINDICKKFAGNRVNEHGNVSRRGVIPTFSDLEVIALSLTAEAFGYDSENNLFKRLAESPEHIPNLISRRQFNVRRKLTACLAEDIRRDIAKSIDGGENVFVIDSKPVKVCQLARAKRCVMGNDNPQSAPSKGFCASQQMYYYGYKLHAICGISGVIHSYDITAANVHDIHYLDDAKWDYHDCLMLGDKGYLSAEVQQDLFETAHIKLEVPYRLNQKNWRNPSWAYRRFRKRIETVFSQLNDQFMMVRNYAKQTGGLFTRTAAKIAAMTVLQYINFCNHRKIGLVKDALF